MGVAKTLRDLKRLKKIVNVLFKLELGFLIEKLDLKSYLTFNKKLQKEKFRPRAISPQKIRQALEELSGTFIKLGQLLSLRPDLIPKEYSQEFEKLQDNINPFHYTIAKRIIESELKKPIREVFKSFEKTPIASASIGQVHKAQLKTGETVAIKIQRPGIRKIFEADIDILYYLAHLVERHMPELKHYNPTEIIKEFESYTKDELDYMKEGKNIDIFYHGFKEDKGIKIPKIFWDYTTKKVLTMEFIEGTKITDVKDFKKFKTTKKQIVDEIAKFFIKQVLERGYFHADPHPGNIFITPKGKIALLDYGIVGKLDKELTLKIENLFLAMVEGDRNLLADSLIELGFVTEDVNLAEFREDLAFHLGSYHDEALKDIKISVLFYDMLAIARKYKLKFPKDFVLLIKSVVTTESFSQTLNPEFNFVKTCEPLVEKIEKERSSPNYIMESLKKNLFLLKHNVFNFPEELSKTLKSIQRGKIRVDIQDEDIKRFSLEVDRSSNRIVFGLIMASLIIASALVMLAKLPPLLFGIPWLGIIFMILAIITAIFLVISISKEKGGD